MDITLLHHMEEIFDIYNSSFNPCFNGYYTFTRKGIVLGYRVLDGFNPCFNGYYTFTDK